LSRIRLVAVALLVCCWLPAAARAVSERATLHASFAPDRLGAPTTISFNFHVETSEGVAPPPMTRIALQLVTNVPLVSSVPGGPDVSIVSIQSTIGPSHLTYYKHVHGRRVGFHPRGVSVPERCPHGGFPFAAQFAFQDGSQVAASTTVLCPARKH
jgi:hypothetical protein